jgi:hypothetical protein
VYSSVPIVMVIKDEHQYSPVPIMTGMQKDMLESSVNSSVPIIMAIKNKLDVSSVAIEAATSLVPTMLPMKDDLDSSGPIEMASIKDKMDQISLSVPITMMAIKDEMDLSANSLTPRNGMAIKDERNDSPMLNAMAVPIAIVLKDEIELSVTIDMASINDEMPSFEVNSTKDDIDSSVPFEMPSIKDDIDLSVPTVTTIQDEIDLSVAFEMPSIKDDIDSSVPNVMAMKDEMDS